MLRIIGGKNRGRIIETVKGISTRPTSDRVKESLFNILQSHMVGSNVLDLFSGTGNLGLEALSRGAALCVFVEKDKRALSVLRENCSSLSCNDKTIIIGKDVLSAITSFESNVLKFDIVFMDPPYKRGYENSVVEALSDRGIVHNKGIIVIEHDSNDLIDDNIGSFKRINIRKYGNTSISFYRPISYVE